MIFEIKKSGEYETFRTEASWYFLFYPCFDGKKEKKPVIAAITNKGLETHHSELVQVS